MELDLSEDLNLDDQEIEQLDRIVPGEEEALDLRLVPVARAALEEYVRLFLGQKVFTRGRDIREYRLTLLMSKLFGNSIPDESKVSALFQTTESESRSLIKSAVSKYQYELQEAIDSTLEQLVRTADPEDDGGHYLVEIHTKSLVDALNRRLASHDGTLPMVRKVRNTVATYRIKESAYRVLAEEFGVQTNG